MTTCCSPSFPVSLARFGDSIWNRHSFAAYKTKAMENASAARATDDAELIAQVARGIATRSARSTIASPRRFTRSR
jgi:hypothetical protein